MNKLLNYLNNLSEDGRVDFSSRCGTSIGYLRKACSVKQHLGANICIAIERATNGVVRCEDLRPDVDWAYLRATDCQTKQAA